jgi:hypothetical protein
MISVLNRMNSDGGSIMRTYETKEALIDEINKRAELFVSEFDEVDEADKDTICDGVDRTPAQMIAYQLGWMNLLLDWEQRERAGQVVVTPSEDYKWNNLGGLYVSFYRQYEDWGLCKLQSEFKETVARVVQMVRAFSNRELFEPGQRHWASSTPSNWPVAKAIHMNTVAPFTTFRAKIRRWKRSA